MGITAKIGRNIPAVRYEKTREPFGDRVDRKEPGPARNPSPSYRPQPAPPSPAATCALRKEAAGQRAIAVEQRARIKRQQRSIAAKAAPGQLLLLLGLHLDLPLLRLHLSTRTTAGAVATGAISSITANISTSSTFTPLIGLPLHKIFHSRLHVPTPTNTISYFS